MTIALIILVGLMVGSFLNVCIYRIPREESVVLGSSHCTSCSEKIRWYDLIPVLSYLMLKGKCRKCKSKISIKYPMVEVLNAVLYLILFYKYDLAVNFYIFATMASICILIAFIDYEHQIIPDRLVILTLLAALSYRIYSSVQSNVYWIIYDGLIAAFGVFLIFLLLMVFSRGGMGGGDVKLIFPIGLMFGVERIAYVLLISSVLASIYGVILLITKKANRKTPIPFGTFLAMGVYVMLVMGHL
ncbi:MAG: hypothetical protein A2Y24_07955 [Clostridiales bacterium GWE2_32_10]|nr:MAG: hypothetical protein A2Y24_07955 [Clostridiales bacterium GWE2_32_10]HBY20539.1 prepilin peptidase [Clostridiales bacterium]